MKLSELFPDGTKIIIQGKEHEVKISTRSLLQFEKDYPENMVINDGVECVVTTQEQIATLINKAISEKGLKVSALINLLYAALLHTKEYPTKESLIEVIEPKDFSDYVDAIVLAYIQSQPTTEQIEKLEVMSQAGDTKKKAESEITEQSTLSTE
jgi:Phage protein.